MSPTKRRPHEPQANRNRPPIIFTGGQQKRALAHRQSEAVRKQSRPYRGQAEGGACVPEGDKKGGEDMENTRDDYSYSFTIYFS